MRVPIHAFLVLAVALLGCSTGLPDATRDALRSAERFELLALDPEPMEAPSTDSFHGFRVLGRVEPDAASRAALVDALDRGVREHDGRVAACFIPRHGIRVTRGGAVRDLVICFECLQVNEYEGDARVPGFLVAESPRAAFDAALRAGGVEPAAR
jgi:hypothetical protein